jgi:uncharacterized membrane protein
MTLVIIGGIIAFIGAIRLLIQAFSTSIFWGLIILLINPLVILYVAANWHEAKGPFINQIIGISIMMAGIFLNGG